MEAAPLSGGRVERSSPPARESCEWPCEWPCAPWPRRATRTHAARDGRSRRRSADAIAAERRGSAKRGGGGLVYYYVLSTVQPVQRRGHGAMGWQWPVVGNGPPTKSRAVKH
eukprot:scaffold2782_cov29-Tisochrysis_lutea.AAC.3